MAEKAVDVGDEFLLTEERAVLSSEAVTLAARAHVAQAAGKLAVELGLSPEAGHSLVAAFRTRLTPEVTDQLSAAAELQHALEHLREVTAKYGRATLAAVAHVPQEKVAEAEVAREEVTLVVEGGNLEADTDPDIAEATIDEPVVIQLNKRAEAYLQTIFGDISELELQEADKLTIAKTLNDLRGVGGSRPLGDMTMQFQLLLAGLKDGEIADHIQKRPGSVATGFSMTAKRIKTKVGYSAESARRTLLKRLEVAKARKPLGEEVPEPVIEETDEVVVEQVGVPQQAWQLRESVQTGKLQGAIRLQLRKANHDHTIELGEARLADLITTVFTQDQAPDGVRRAYEQYLATGVPEFGNEQLRAYIHDMPRLIAGVLTVPAEVTNVLPLSTPTEHHPTPRATPAVMPRKQTVLPFAPPQNQRHHAEGQENSAPHYEQTREVPALVAAAYNENAMSPDVWYKTAYAFIAEEVPQRLGITDAEARGLWNAVHFSKGDAHKLRPPETQAALHALQAAMEEMDDDDWRSYPELQACLRKLLNPFPPQSLGAIQRSLQAKDATISGNAAQRYVVAAIYELTKDRYGEATA